MAGFLKLDFPSIEAIARLCPDRRTLRHGQIEADESLYWADPGLFDVLPLQAIAACSVLNIGPVTFQWNCAS